jgi:hypothetical protein
MKDDKYARFPLYLKGKEGVLFVPSAMTNEDFNLLKQQIDNALAMAAEVFVSDELADLQYHAPQRVY